MKVKTTRRPWGPLELEVEKADSDGDVLVATRYGVFYINRRDVPALIRALKWAIQDGPKPGGGR